MSKEGEKFSKKYDRVELYWVPDSMREEYLLDEKSVKKIPQIKSVNCLTAMKGNSGVYRWDVSISV